MKTDSLLERVHKDFCLLTEELIRQHLTVSCMESCTSGLIGSLITDTLGASAVFKGGIISYSNEIKIASGVPEDVIRIYGVYSAETALAMAETVKRKMDTDLAVGVTGSLCSADPANGDSVPGTVYLAVTGRKRKNVKKILADSALSRFEAKLFAAEEACAMLKNLLDEQKKENV